MAAMYWIGGAGTWAAGKWSNSDGGASNGTTPGPGDPVYFTALSGTGNITLNNGTCLSLDATGFGGKFNSGIVSIYSTSITWGGTFGSSQFEFNLTADTSLAASWFSTGPKIAFWMSAGKTLTLTSQLSGTYKLIMFSGSLNVGAFNHVMSTFMFNGQNGAGDTLTLGSQTLELTGGAVTAAIAWASSGLQGGTIAGSAWTIKWTGSGVYLWPPVASGTLTAMGTFWSAGGRIHLLGATNICVCGTLKASPGCGYDYAGTAGNPGQWQPTTFDINGTAGSPAILNLQNLYKTSATVTFDYATITSSTFSGGATFKATHSTDGGGNTGITFVAGANAGFAALFEEPHYVYEG